MIIWSLAPRPKESKDYSQMRLESYWAREGDQWYLLETNHWNYARRYPYGSNGMPKHGGTWENVDPR